MSIQETKDLIAELRKNATGDFAKFNDETLLAIYETENNIDLVKCKDFEDLKRSLLSDDEC